GRGHGALFPRWRGRVSFARPRRRTWVSLAALLLLAAASPFAVIHMTRMPGQSHGGPLPPFSSEELALAERLERDVRHLALAIGPRDLWNPGAREAAASWIEAELAAAGHAVEREPYFVGAGVHVN